MEIREARDDARLPAELLRSWHLNGRGTEQAYSTNPANWRQEETKHFAATID